MDSITSPVISDRIAAMRKALLSWERTIAGTTLAHTRDPYCILIAEILLHRTRADQVCPVYLRFLETFPDLSVADQCGA